MRDAIGNKISEGDIVKWEIPPEAVKRLLLNVVRVSDGGIATPDGNTPGIIQLSLIIPTTAPERGGEIQLQDFICLRNPKSEELLAKLSEGPKQ